MESSTRAAAPFPVMPLVAMGLGVLILANDFSALNVALPQIEKDFDAPVSTVQWVVNAYALVFGMLIVSGGRIADLFGRRKIFFVGTAIFIVFSIAGGAAQDIDWLLAARGLMGIGGALMWPAILGMTFAALPGEKAGLAGGLILGVAGLGNVIGPLLGGVLTDVLSWRWIFFANVPIAAFAVLVTIWKMHQPAVESADERIDYAGIATLSVALVALLVALDQVTDWGWGDPRIIALLALFVVLLPVFVAIERRMGRNALIPPDVARNTSFAMSCLAILMMSATFFASLLYLPQFMIKLFGYNPIEAGLGLLPMMGMFALASFVAGPLYNRAGPKLIIGVGAACIAVGAFLLSIVHSDSTFSSLVPGMVLLGIGLGLFYSSATTAGVTAVGPARSSLAGGLVYMFQIAGGSVGLGLTTTVFTSGIHSSLAADAGAGVPDRSQNAVHGILAGTESAKQALADFTSKSADQVMQIVREAFAAGFHAALLLDAGLAFVGFLIAVFFVGGRLRLLPRRAAPESAAAPESEPA
jgi:EmrB/QacA subfamily drug resistance transporter